MEGGITYKKESSATDHLGHSFVESLIAVHKHEVGTETTTFGIRLHDGNWKPSGVYKV